MLDQYLGPVNNKMKIHYLGSINLKNRKSCKLVRFISTVTNAMKVVLHRAPAIINNICSL